MELGSHLPLLIDLHLKSAVLIAFAALLTAVLRHTSAANRHGIGLAALIALLVLPFTQLGKPLWSYALKNGEVVESVILESQPTAVKSSAGSGAALSRVDSGDTWEFWSSIPAHWPAMVVGLWAAGTVFVLMRRAVGQVKLRLIASRSRVMSEGRAVVLARDIAADWGVRAQIRESETCRVPLVFGVWRPVVLLPSEALAWSDERLSAALRHEFGHIRRRDVLTRWLADLACAFYWMNPLAWHGVRFLRLAQEQACDDLVLRSGICPDAYATQLVEVVRSLRRSRFGSSHALAMAQPSSLEVRVRAIVDASRDRTPRGLRGAWAGGVLALFVLALCTVAQLRGADGGKASAVANDKERQVEVEAIFVEYSGKDGDLPEFLRSFVRMTKPGVGGLVSGEVANKGLKALREIKGLDVLSSPRVLLRPKMQGVIAVGREFVYPKEWETDAPSGKGQPKALDNRFIGVRFGVTADLTAGGAIQLQLAPEVTEFEGFVMCDKSGRVLGDGAPVLKPGSAPRPPDGTEPGDLLKQPIFSTRKVEASVTLEDGQMVVLGGLQRKWTPDVPGADAGGSPIQKGAEQGAKTLMVLVTARVLAP